MKRFLTCLWIVCLLAAAAPPAGAADDEGFKVFWKEGLRMETADKQFQLKIVESFGRRPYFRMRSWRGSSCSASIFRRAHWSSRRSIVFSS